MTIVVKCIGFKAQPELQSFVRQKVAKLFPLHPRMVGAEVFLKPLRTPGKENKAVLVRLAIPGNDLISQTQGVSFETALVRSVESLRGSLERRKAKQRSFDRVAAVLL